MTYISFSFSLLIKNNYFPFSHSLFSFNFFLFYFSIPQISLAIDKDSQSLSPPTPPKHRHSPARSGQHQSAFCKLSLLPGCPGPQYDQGLSLFPACFFQVTVLGPSCVQASLQSKK